ncbi:uncharacterized protein LOC142520313 [Primulina tabacum]|uniref:uncharacterized protein LOC142520313 n=1 Tax=Primulina tabacum TaxID=48773 RepID=UPI003F5A7C64
MPPRCVPSTDRQADTHEDRRKNAPPPPNGDSATRVLEGVFRYATYMLRDDASLWWEEADQGVDLATLTWVRFKDILYEKYFTADVKGRLKREFMSLPQEAAEAAELSANQEAFYGTSQSLGGAKAPRTVEKVGVAEATTVWSRPDVQRKATVQEEGHKAIDCPKKKGPTIGRAYVMHAEEAETKPDTTLITGMIFISSVAIYALLDLGATHSFIFETFVKRLNILPEDLNLGFRVSIPSSDRMVTMGIVRNLELRLLKNLFQTNLIVLPMPEFDIILGMDWLSLNGTSIDFWQITPDRLDEEKCEVYLGIKLAREFREAEASFDFIVSSIDVIRKELNMGNQRWIELGKNYDYDISYHP